MPSVTFTPNVPLSTQKINATQQTINNNFLCLDNNVNGFTVDHQTMTDTSNGGKHLQVSFFGNNVPGSTPSGQNSILYTNAGTADATHPQVFWKNANAIYSMSGVRAFGTYPGNSTTLANGFNIDGATGSNGSYTITLSAGAVSSAAFSVLVSCQLIGSNQAAIDYSSCAYDAGTKKGSFQVFIRTVGSSPTSGNATWSFLVLQI